MVDYWNGVLSPRARDPARDHRTRLGRGGFQSLACVLVNGGDIPLGVVASRLYVWTNVAVFAIAILGDAFSQAGISRAGGSGIPRVRVAVARYLLEDDERLKGRINGLIPLRILTDRRPGGAGLPLFSS